MALDLDEIVGGDVQITTLNEALALIKAAINNLDGSQVVAATVTNAKLAKPKQWFAPAISKESVSGLTTGTKFAEWRVPPVDGAVNATWKFLGVSVFFQAIAVAAGNNFLIQEDGVTKQTIDLNDATLVSSGTIGQSQYRGFGDATLVSAYATASDKRWSVVFTKSGAPTYTGLLLVPVYSLEHVGT